MVKISKQQIKQSVVNSNEVIYILGISRQRLSQLKRSNKLTPLKKGLYLLEDVMKRKKDQEELRKQYYRKRAENL